MHYCKAGSFIAFLTTLSFSLNVTALDAVKRDCLIERCPLPSLKTVRYSGFFGEIRGRHFHSGVDIKTNQKTGLKVEAFKDGYVYRVSISLSGYGKAIYIKHPNGFISLYGHLEKFSAPIEAYVKAKQYETESYTINIYPKKKIYVKKGETIGYSGNSGRSFGPHLHFELRDEKQNPINPFLYGLKAKDNTPPEVTALYLSFLTKTKQFKDLKLSLKPTGKNVLTTPVQKISGKIGFKIGTFDRHDLSYNKNGTYLIETFLNKTKYMSIRSDKIKFQESILLNDHIDYEKLTLENINVQKLYVDHAKINTFKYIKGDGSINIKPGERYTFKIILSDISNNKKTILVPIVGEVTPKEKKDPISCKKKNLFMIPKGGYSFEKKPFKVIFPKSTFFDDPQPICLEIENNKLLLSPNTIPLKKDISITYTGKKPEKSIPLDKYAIVQTKENDTIFLQTRINKIGSLMAKTHYLGTYFITEDTIPPSIKPKHYTPVWWVLGVPTIQLLLSDDDSGIKQYRATINGKWIPMEYDLKSSTLTYYHNDNTVKQDSTSYLKVFAQDKAGNISEYRTPLYGFTKAH